MRVRGSLRTTQPRVPGHVFRCPRVPGSPRGVRGAEGKTDILQPRPPEEAGRKETQASLASVSFSSHVFRARSVRDLGTATSGVPR